MQCAVSTLQRIFIRNMAGTIGLFSGSWLKHSLRVLLIMLSKPSRKMLLKLKNICDQLAIRTLLLPAFHCLDLFIILLIL
jgi:hypothetical protein